jgi:tRNA (guanine-N7-)-methyltransferase
MLAGMRQASAKQLGHRQGKWDTRGVLLDEAVARGPIDLAAVFGSRRPVEVEIGTGKGTFLLARAAARPEVNLLGIEYARSYCAYAADRVRRAGLANVRLLRAEAAHVFRACLAPRSVLRVHVYFPDPWPKRRHHGRRLIQPAFVAEVRRVLRPGGELLIVTDHLPYFRWITGVLDGARGFANVPFPQMADASGEIVGTNFERKYIAQGRPFYRIARMRYV